MGTQRCPVETHRTDLATQTTDRRSRAPVAGYAGGTQRNPVGFGYGGAVARTAPEISAPYQTCHRRFQQWVREGKLERILRVLAEELHARGKLGTGGGFYRRLLLGGKKGGLAVGPTRRGKRTKIIAITDDHSLPLAVSVESASPHESQLVEGVLGQSFLDTLPTRLIGDKAYDSDRLDRDLADRYGIEMIAPHRGPRRAPTQDGRPLRRYRKRWRVERLLPGFITFVGWSFAGNTTSRTSSAWCASVACKSCSDIYETSSSLYVPDLQLCTNSTPRCQMNTWDLTLTARDYWQFEAERKRPTGKGLSC